MPETDQIIAWLVIGGLAGAAAGLLVRRELYVYEIVLAGLLGAVVGGILVEVLGINLPDKSITVTVGDLITAFIGATVLIVLAEIIMGTRRGRRY